MGPPPTSDETGMAQAAAALLDAVRADLGPWCERMVLSRRPDLADAAADAAARCVARLLPELERLLAIDVDRQRTTPLSLLRTAVREPTAVLASAGELPVDRDEFARRHDPEDLYGMAPASFAAISPAVGAAGMTWGAAKAFVHLTRRRGATPA